MTQPPPRRAAPTLRSFTPAPATVSLQDVRKLGVVKARLVHALNTCDTLVLLREAVVDLACDLGDAGAQLEPTQDEHEAPTQRSLAPWNDEQPPSIEVDSDLGRDFGGG